MSTFSEAVQYVNGNGAEKMENVGYLLANLMFVAATIDWVAEHEAGVCSQSCQSFQWLPSQKRFHEQELL